MGKMIRSKREFKCTMCDVTHITWQGICKGCGASGTLQEITIIPSKTVGRGTDTARRLRRRAKDSERNIAKRMVAVDGHDPNWKHIASTTGRIGHVSGIRVDAVSKTYVTENKNRKVPTWMIDAWLLINQRAHDFNKNALLHVEPPNAPRDFLINGQSIKLDTMAIITQTRHEELIRAERALQKATEILLDFNMEEQAEQVFAVLNGQGEEKTGG